MDIVIGKESVLESVRMNVSIIGRSYKDSEGNSLWDKIVIQDRDEGLMEQHWNSSYASVLAGMKNFLAGHDDTTLTLDGNRRFNESVVSDLKEVVEGYLINRMTAEWLKIKAVEFAAGYADAAEVSMSSLMEKLRVKTEPALKKFDK